VCDAGARCATRRKRRGPSRTSACSGRCCSLQRAQPTGVWGRCYSRACPPSAMPGCTPSAPSGPQRCAHTHCRALLHEAGTPGGQVAAAYYILLDIGNLVRRWTDVEEVGARCAQVYQNMDGNLEAVGYAVRRGRMIKCRFCGYRGATLGCHIRSCRTSFHLPCARYNGSRLDVCTPSPAPRLHCPLFCLWREIHSSENSGQDVRKTWQGGSVRVFVGRCCRATGV
jgi:hypothetical protein